MDFEGPGNNPPMAWDGRRIIALRRELNLTQDQLARTLQVRPKTLRLWEEGRGIAVAWAVPRLDRLEKKLGKSQVMTEARKKSGISATGQQTQQAAGPSPKRRRPRSAAPTLKSSVARSAARIQKAREIQRLMRRMG